MPISGGILNGDQMIAVLSDIKSTWPKDFRARHDDMEERQTMRQNILAVLVMGALATNALAHAKAENTSPANEATVKTVDVIEMRFDDPMRVTAITLTGPDGEVAIERETGMEAVTEFRALPQADLTEGEYTVDWRGLAADGHPMQGTFRFTVAH